MLYINDESNPLSPTVDDRINKSLVKLNVGIII